MPIRIFSTEAGIPLPLIAQNARLVVGPHSDAHQAVMNWVALQPGESNKPHLHAESEDTIFVLAGDGVVRNFDTGQVHVIPPRSAVYVPVGVRHAVEAGPQGMVSVGGPVPPDLAMLRAAGFDV